MISSVLLFFTNREIRRIHVVTNIAPRTANKDKENFSFSHDIWKDWRANTPIATPSVLPEEIPKTEGPASGFLNMVCINKPARAIPAPQIIAVIVLGILNLNISSFTPSIGAITEPKTIPKKDKIPKLSTKTINFLVSVMRKSKTIFP